MSDQPTPDPPDDPAQPDSALPAADRTKIRDTAQALVDGSLRMDSDDYLSLPARIRRRAWMRYQAANEDREGVREKNARAQAAEENHQVDVDRAIREGRAHPDSRRPR